MRLLAITLLAALSSAQALSPLPKGVRLPVPGPSSSATPKPAPGPDARKCAANLRALIGQDLTMRIFTLAPKPVVTKEGTFHGFKILDQSSVRQPQNQRTLLGALARDIAAGDDIPGCFIPHHGLRIEHHGHTTDFVICYSCGAVRVIGWPGLAVVPLADDHLDLINKIFAACGLTSED